jgi:UDP-2,3-diacylglucosamine pyrophosphatase LpxH
MKKTVDTVRIPYKYGDIIKVKPIADVHYGSKNCDIKGLLDHLGKPDPKTYFIGLGDFMDCIIVSDSKRYRKVSDDIESEDIIGESIQFWADLLYPFRKQIIGLGIGNHEDNIIKRCSVNPMKILCDSLEVPYLGYSFLVRLILREGEGRSRTVIIRCHHGWGMGGRTIGGELTKYSRDLAQFDCDIALYGHTHRLQADTMPRLAIVGDRLVSKEKHLVLCGTFLKTFSDGTDCTYAESAGLPPMKIGAPIISIKPNNEWCKISVEV